MLLLRHCLRITMVVAGATALAAGCGGLRELPVNGHDAAAGGASGSAAGAGPCGGGSVTCVAESGGWRALLVAGDTAVAGGGSGRRARAGRGGGGGMGGTGGS